MPQLKKITLSRNNTILPKLEFAVENGYPNYEVLHQDLTTYVPIFDSKSCTGSSEAESDGACSISHRPRKRQRLDHLSQEEKIMRRKMKNRVAAQTARDRKKAKMAELEEQVIELESERKMLMLVNVNLQAKNEALMKENDELKLRLSGKDENTPQVKEEIPSVQYSEEVDGVESRLSDSSRSIEHAEGTRSATAYSLDDAFRLLANDSETDAFLDILQQYTENLLQLEDPSSSLSELSDIATIPEHETPASEVVGTSSKSLESHKELKHFDHIYYKQEEASLPDHSVLLSSDLSTKDCNMDISNSLDTGCIVEVDSSEIPVISISESADDSEPPLEVLQFKNLHYSNLQNSMLSVTDMKPVPSPVSSDGGYDSSFSVSSPGSSAVNPWDDTLSELFPSLV